MKIGTNKWKQIYTWNQSESESHSVMSDALRPHRLYSPWNSPDQNTGVSSLSLLQGIFPTQGANPGLWQCRRILYQLSHRLSQIIVNDQEASLVELDEGKGKYS